MDQATWESLFDCPIDVRRLHSLARVTYAALWGRDPDAAEAPAQGDKKNRPPASLVRRALAGRMRRSATHLV